MKKLLFIVFAILLVACENKKAAETTPIVEQNTKEVVESEATNGPEMDASDFVNVADAVPDVILEIRYYSTYNFVGDRIDGYEAPVALLTKEAAAALKKASDTLIAQGYRLKVFDAYRPQTAVNHFIRWAKDVEDAIMKEYFYPQVDKSRLFELGFICAKSSHSRGSTIDLTLFDMATGREVDMGCPFDWFGQESHPSYTNLTKKQLEMRQLLRNTMINAGFSPFDTEWWHFTLKNEPYPETYFDFPNQLLSDAE